MFDLTTLFIEVFNLSISAGWIVLAVVLLRFLLKKAPKWINCIWWLLVGMRLVFPFSIESIFSLIPSSEVVSPDIIYSPSPSISTGIPALNSVVNPVISGAFAPDPANSVNPLQVVAILGSYVWLIGVAAMLIYAVVCYALLKRKMRTAVKYEGNIFESENVQSPFILGMIKPKIYLPFGLTDENRNHIISHENAHLKRKDHLIKPIAYLILSVYWFNPLMWLSYVLLCRDIELACDEKAVKNFAHEERQEYSLALLQNSIHRRMIAACPLAFGEVGVKQRVKSVMNYKKPAFWVIVVALIASVVASVCLLTNPVSDDKLKPGLYKEGELIYSERATSYISENLYGITEDNQLYISDNGITTNIGVLDKINLDNNRLKTFTFLGEAPELDRITSAYVTRDWDSEDQISDCTLHYIVKTVEGDYFMIKAFAPTLWIDAVINEKGETEIGEVGQITVNSIRKLTFEGKIYTESENFFDQRLILTKEEKLDRAITEALRANAPVHFGKRPMFTTESFTILANEEQIEQTDLYTNLVVGETVAIFYHRNSYNYENSQLSESISSNTAIISFDLDSGDNYTFREFSEKKKDDHDSAYVKTFHLMVNEEDYNFEELGNTLTYSCREKAMAHFKIADWIYSPMLSASFHYACPITFSIDYDKIKLTCSDGTLVKERFGVHNEYKTEMTYEKGDTPIWTPIMPGGAQSSEEADFTEITFRLYKNGRTIYKGKMNVRAQENFTTLLGTMYIFELTEADRMLVVRKGEAGPVVRVSDTSNEIVYYKEPVAERNPYRTEIAHIYLESPQLERLKDIIEEAEWEDVGYYDKTNEEVHYVDGELRLTGGTTYYFSDEDNVLVNSPYLAKLSDEDIIYIMSLQTVREYHTAVDDGTFASLRIYPADNHFEFTPHALSSAVYYGEYEETDKKIVLRDRNTENFFTFKKSRGTLIFDEKNSSTLPKYKGAETLSDGAMFTQ